MEELNQIQTEVEETPTDDNSFLDGFDDATPSTDDNLFNEEEEVEEPTEPKAKAEEEVVKDEEIADDFLTIRYNKEDKKLSKEEAITLSQKGMNYDNVKAKYDDLNDQINRLAKMNGMSNEEFMSKLNDMQSQFAIQNEVESLKQQYPNAEQELLEEVARKNLDEQFKTEQKEVVDENQVKLKKELDDFTELYPDVDASKLDEEVYEMMSNGKTLLEAYLIHENKVQKAQQEKQEKIASQNAKTKAKSFGNTTNVGSNTEDLFLSTFLKD